MLHANFRSALIFMKKMALGRWHRVNTQRMCKESRQARRTQAGLGNRAIKTGAGPQSAALLRPRPCRCDRAPSCFAQVDALALRVKNAPKVRRLSYRAQNRREQGSARRAQLLYCLACLAATAGSKRREVDAALAPL